MKNARPTVLLVAVFLLAGLPAPLAAQEPESALAAMQTKEALTDDDRAGIRTWINQQIAGVADTDPVNAQAAFRRLRDSAKGTPAFIEAYLTASIEAIGSAYKKTDTTPAARLIAIINVLNDRRSADLLLEALKDDRAAVRAAAVIALRNLQSKLAANADLYGRTLSTLKDAGQRESSRQTLRLIYRAMDYTAVQPTPELRQCAVALLELLEHRVGQYGDQSVPAEGAEVEALARGKTWHKALDEAQRKRYALLLAKLLHYGVGRYTGGERPLGQVRDKVGGPDLIALRNATELLIKEAEVQLTEMLSPEEAPGVAEAMRRAKKTERAHLADMILEMNKWAPTFKDKLDFELTPLNAPPPPEEDEP